MILPTLALLTLSAPAQAWELAPPFQKGETTAWNTNVAVNVQGTDLSVRLTYVFRVTEVSEKETRGNVVFADLEVEGMAQDSDGEFDLRLSPRGNALASQSEHGDAFRRMSAPIFLVYPDKPVSIGDKWTLEHRGSEGGTFTFKCEARGEEKVGDKEALKIHMTTSEDAGDRTSSDGMYWVSRDGKVLKFEIKIKNWIVPMADGQPVDATVTGVLK